MGAKMGPSYANLFVGYNEHQFFNQYNGPKPDLCSRYIDDCIGATSSTREELDQFITAVNSFHPALKYTWEISDTSLSFLDIEVSVESNGLCTSVHYKPTDSRSYLLYSSSHPSHVIPFLILSFLDFVAFVVTTLIFPKNQRKCAKRDLWRREWPGRVLVFEYVTCFYCCFSNKSRSRLESVAVATY